MKTLKIITVGIVLLLSNLATAQVSVNVNLGTPPAWGPVGYTEVEYYYLPDVETYYDVRSSRFIYYNGSTWIRSKYLPRKYRGYDLYGGYKVVLNDYHGSSPYVHFNNHKVKYHKGYNGGHQKTIGVKNQKSNGAGKSHHKQGKGKKH